MPGLHGDQEFIEIQTDMIQVVFNLHPLTDTLCQFRVRAIGPNNLEGPWSDPAEHMAP